MKRNLLRFVTAFAALPFAAVTAQTTHFTTPPELRLPRDTALCRQLLSSLDGFLEAKERDNDKNPYVWQPELMATAALLDEMKGLGIAGTGPEVPGAARLSGCTALRDSTYLMQLSYLDMTDGILAYKAAFRVLARREGDHFLFYAPLRRNTRGWQSYTSGGVTFYYKDGLNRDIATQYAFTDSLYRQKLGLQERHTDLYCCDDFQEALQLTGIDYKAAYNGISANTLSASGPHSHLSINGYFTPAMLHFDPHDQWHALLRSTVDPGMIHKPVDEGCAYLYGGSWGISWEEIRTLFRAYVRDHPGADWLQLYREGVDFKKSPQPLKVSYYINALIVQRLEQEKGFAAVRELLLCGKQDKEEANYFRTLQQLTGVDKEGFNHYVQALIAAP